MLLTLAHMGAVADYPIGSVGLNRTEGAKIFYKICLPSRVCFPPNNHSLYISETKV